MQMGNLITPFRAVAQNVRWFASPFIRNTNVKTFCKNVKTFC